MEAWLFFMVLPRFEGGSTKKTTSIIYLSLINGIHIFTNTVSDFAADDRKPKVYNMFETLEGVQFFFLFFFFFIYFCSKRFSEKIDTARGFVGRGGLFFRKIREGGKY